MKKILALALALALLAGCSPYTVNGDRVSKEVYDQTNNALDDAFDLHMKEARELAEQRRLENLKVK